MRGKIRSIAMLSAFVGLTAFMVQEVDARGRGGGGGGGRGGGGEMEEKPGSTRIISILPEGTPVKEGDVVCELDSAAFKDEYRAQQIRETQAKTLVEQAQAILDVTEITLREFRDGIYPQDALLIRQYIHTCRIQEEQARQNVEWSREAHRKQYRATAQLNADVLAHQQAQIALREAEGMALRLDKFTAPRVLKSLEAKLAAIRADKSAREATYELERSRLKKLGEMIEFCTLRAPGDGIVVYAKESNGWGRTTAQIEQGVTVRQGQAIFHLPDPKKMLVKTRINESKVSMVRPGQRADILVDAFPDQPLRGTVQQVTAIPTPLNGPFSDVRAYFATVAIDEGGLEGLRPGLSAQVSFEIDERRQVTRVPLQAIRRVGDAMFAAVWTSADDSAWEWRKVSIGMIDPTYAEVIQGLKPGERVVERPDALPAPAPAAISNVANAAGAARG
jgi:HlyD family secretion protein